MKTRKTRLEVSEAFSNLVRVAYFILEILRTDSWSQEITWFNWWYEYCLHYIRSHHYSYNLGEYTEIMSLFFTCINCICFLRLEKLEGLLLYRVILLVFNLVIKSGCQRKPGKMLKMSTEGGQQNKFIRTSQIGLVE